MSALDQSANTCVAEVPDTHRLDEASLTRWMERHVESFRGPLSVSKFKGGQSNPIYRLEASGAYCNATGRDGIADWRFYVAFNFFRRAAIFHGIAGRAKRGSASSAHAQERARSFPQLAELGVRALEEAL